MARSQARIHTSVWRDREFTALPLATQAAYWMILSQPDMTLAGVVPYVPARWSNLAGGEPVAPRVAELEDAGFVVVDEQTGEVWVRTFTRHDGVMASPKTRRPMWSAWKSVLSPIIRSLFFEQMDNEAVSEAVEQGWITPADTISDGVSDTPTDRPRVRARADSDSDNYSDSDSDNDTSGKPDATVRFPDEVNKLTREFAQLVLDNGHTLPEKGSSAAGLWLVAMDRLRRLGPKGNGQHPPGDEEIRAVMRWALTESDFWPANIQSVPTFRDKYTRLRAQMARDSRNGSGQVDFAELRAAARAHQEQT